MIPFMKMCFKKNYQMLQNIFEIIIFGELSVVYPQNHLDVP